MKARAVVALLEADGVGAFSGHASLAPGAEAADLILAAEAALALARRGGPGTVFG